jgi:hypothetical protein
MVSKYPYAVTSSEEFEPIGEASQQSEAKFGGRILGFVRQMFCRLHGHDSMLHFEQDRMSLKCVSCGYESPGWELNETPPTHTAERDTRRQPVMSNRLISERRIA